MTKECFLKQFADGKKKMDLNQAANLIRRMLADYPMLPKTGHLNRLEYVHRLAQRTACMELETAMRNASPWEDYREIIADYEWGYMRRAAMHSMEDRWKGPDGKKWGMSDAWIIEMWFAYHDIYRRMPGEIPDITPWRIYDHLIWHIERKTRKYRRNL